MVELTIFGFTGHGDVNIETISFILIIAYLIVAEWLLSSLNEYTKHTSYAEMIQALYKDLTITGLMSFLLTLLLGTDSLRASAWVVYLQAAEIVLFFATLIRVVFSALLIFNNTQYMSNLKVQLEKESVDLTDEFKKLSPFQKSNFCFWKAGIRGEIELRVFRIMFHAYYRLSRSFDFARYLALCQEKNIINMLEVNPTHWIVFVFLLAVNWVLATYSHHQSSKIGLSFVDNQLCDQDDKNHNKDCVNVTTQLLLFTFATVVHLIATSCIAVTSRIYELRLIGIVGPKHPDEYISYILKDEKSDLEKSDVKERISWKELKDHIEHLKSAEDNDDDGTSLVALIPRRLSNGTLLELYRSTRELLRWASTNSFRRHGVIHSVDNPEEDSTMHRARTSLSALTIDMPRRGSIISAPSFVMEPTADLESQEMAMSSKNHECSSRYKRTVKKTSAKPDWFLFLSESEIKEGVFLFNSPGFYYFCRDSSNWITCLLLAFYLTSFSYLSVKTTDPVGWNVGISCILMCCVLCQLLTIRSSSLIYALSKLDADVIGQVIEEREEREDVVRRLRKKLTIKLQNAVGDRYKETQLAVMQLFSEIKSLSQTNDGYISQAELRLLMQKLNIHFSDKKFKDAFAYFDANQDGKIGLQELFNFIYPEQANKLKRQNRKTRYRESVGLSIKLLSEKLVNGLSQQQTKAPLPVFVPRDKDPKWHSYRKLPNKSVESNDECVTQVEEFTSCKDKRINFIDHKSSDEETAAPIYDPEEHHIRHEVSGSSDWGPLGSSENISDVIGPVAESERLEAKTGIFEGAKESVIKNSKDTYSL